MNKKIFALCALCALAAVSLSTAVAAKPASDKKKAAPTQPSAPVARWLVLGPVLDPLPAFHDEKPGAFDLEARLEDSLFPKAPWTPREGDEESWFGDRKLAWTARAADGAGLVSLEPPPGTAERRPAAAWLAAYVEVGRFRELELEVRGNSVRRAWLDGSPVVSGGAGGKDSEVKKKVALTTGKHLLLVETLLGKTEDGWTAGAAFVPGADDGAAGVTASLDPKRNVRIHDILDPPSISSVASSPDGTYVAASLERVYPGTDKKESWIELYARGLHRTWRGGVEMGDVAWAPGRGDRLSYVSTEPGEGKEDSLSTLWLADLKTHKVVPLLERVAGFAGYRWSPDGKSIAYLTTVKHEPDKRGIKRMEGLMDRWANHRTKRHLNLLTVPGGTRRRLTAGPVSAGLPEFSPDAGKLLFTRVVEDLDDRPFHSIELWEVDLATFESRRLRTSRWLNAASYSPDGKRLLVLGGAQEFGDAGLDVPAGTTPNSYDTQLFVWDPESDQVEAITRDFDPSVTAAEWSRADGKIYLTAQDRDYARVYRYDPEQKSFAPIDTGFDVFRELTLALNAPGAVGVGTSPWVPQGLVALDLINDRKNILTSPAGNWFSDVRRGVVEPWNFTAQSGKTIEGRIYFPPDFDPKQKYPCIVYYYGGTSPTHRGFGGRYPKEYWASNGYVVYTLQPSGATGFGQEFSAIHVNDWGKTTSEEIIEGTKKFLAAHDYVDRKRVGCIGASYGGFMTMLLATKTDIFAAAVSHAGISSLSSYWGEGYWGYSYSAVATANSYPWNRPDVYVDQSPLFRADRTSVPILLTHGAADTNVPVGESDQFYVALKLLGKQVEYLQVEGQNHWILEHDKRVLWSRSIVAWFDRWLKDQPEWWDHLYPERK